jgi:hypothetical protein
MSWSRVPSSPHTSEANKESLGRKAMKHRDMPAPIMGRQMNLAFEPRRLEGLDDTEQRKAVSTLAQILMQAAGLLVEELSDDQR